MPYDSEIFVPTLGRSKRTVRAKLQFYLPKKSFVWTISPTKQPHQMESSNFGKPAGWSGILERIFVSLTWSPTSKNHSALPCCFFHGRMNTCEIPQNSPTSPKKNTISWKVNFCPVFPGNSSTGGLRISPSFFFLVCAVFDRKNYTKGKDLEDICLDLGWLGWRKKGLGGLGSWRDVKYGVPTDM